jgi:GAF domain
MPIDETRRLATLRACNILDTEPEAVFDGLVALAAQIAGTPIALVSLVDESRQWFKARIGLEARETPRELAFCAHAIMEPKPLVVEDATMDSRFADNPLVTGAPGIRSYAGIPLEAGDGLRLGTLCVIDTQPRRLTHEQIAALQILAQQASGQLQLRRVLRELKVLRERELRLADRRLEERATESFSVGQILNDGMAVELAEVAASMQSGASHADMHQRVLAAAHECRAVAHRFRDFSQLSQGWVESVCADIARLETEHGVEIEFDDNLDPDQLLGYAAAHRLAEFTHAALFAVIDHAGARKLQVTLERSGSNLDLRVRHLGGQRNAPRLTANPNSTLRVLAAELGSVVKESSVAFWSEISLSVEIAALTQAVMHRGAGYPESAVGNT